GEAQRPDSGRARARRLGVEEMAQQAPRRRRLSLGGNALFALRRLRRVLEIGLDNALQFDRHRLAVSVEAAPGGDPDPPFRDRVFNYAGLFLSVELDSDSAAQERLVVKLAARVEREAVGRAV